MSQLLNQYSLDNQARLEFLRSLPYQSLSNMERAELNRLESEKTKEVLGLQKQMDKSQQEVSKPCSLQEKSRDFFPQHDPYNPMNEKIPDPNILTEAHTVIYGDREQTYGAPDKNLQTIADLWHIYLGAPINVNDVCVMMILLKASRLKNSPEHHDSQVDICGYAALMERVQKYRKVNN